MLAIVCPGKHLAGVSKKTGNEFDFWTYPYIGKAVHLGCDPEYVSDSLNVDRELKDFTFPCFVEISFDNNGRPEKMDVISEIPAQFPAFFDT